MTALLARLGAPVLRILEPELAHALALKALRFLPAQRAAPDGPELAMECLGMKFPNPVGMAAGFDKNAEVYAQLLGLGFGYAEIGTVTPLAQPGNPRPRMFRLKADRGVVNRLGFNGQGHAAALQRLEAAPPGGIVGVNIGANKDTADRIGDYVSGIRRFAAVASYFTVNVSSPNTPGLRDLQAASALGGLLARVLDARDAAPRRVPVLLKIAPDVSLAELDALVRIARAKAIDGMIVCNTTITRPAALLDRAAAGQAGGLSGRPLFDLSTAMLAATYLRVERQFPLVGAGGIDSAQAAWIKMQAGAHLLQLYTGFVYAGLGLLDEIKTGLSARLRASRAHKLADAVGQEAATLAAR